MAGGFCLSDGFELVGVWRGWVCAGAGGFGDGVVAESAGGEGESGGKFAGGIGGVWMAGDRFGRWDCVVAVKCAQTCAKCSLDVHFPRCGCA